MVAIHKLQRYGVVVASSSSKTVHNNVLSCVTHSSDSSSANVRSDDRPRDHRRTVGFSIVQTRVYEPVVDDFPTPTPDGLIADRSLDASIGVVEEERPTFLDDLDDGLEALCNSRGLGW